MSLGKKGSLEIPDCCKDCEWLKNNECFFMDVPQHFNCEIDEKI